MFAAFQNPAALLVSAESGHVIDTSSHVVFGDVATRQVGDTAYTPCVSNHVSKIGTRAPGLRPSPASLRVPNL